MMNQNIAGDEDDSNGVPTIDDKYVQDFTAEDSVDECYNSKEMNNSLNINFECELQQHSANDSICSDIITHSDDEATVPKCPDFEEGDVNLILNENCINPDILPNNLGSAELQELPPSEKCPDPSKEDFNRPLSRHKKKLKKILNSLINNDVEYLKKAAIEPAGLINDEIRQQVWPRLVGVDVFETSPHPSQEEIENHPYYNQVILDVNRSISRFPPSIQEKQRLAMQDQLIFLIMRVLVRHPEFHYYQGYHDICVTFLLVLGEETAYHVVERLSVTHLNVFMEKTMESTIKLINYMFPLIGKKRPELMNFLIKSEVGVAYCLSWLITWFGHVLNNYDNVGRLFDFFIVSHPWMPVYLSAAIVLHQGTEVMKQNCDMASVHSFLAKISDDLPFETLILQSLELNDRYPQARLEQEYIYLQKYQIYQKRKVGFVNSVVKSIKRSVPTSKLTYSLVIAAAVLVTAVLYQAYK